MIPSKIESLVEAIYLEAQTQALAKLQESEAFWEQLEIATKKRLERTWFFFCKDVNGEPELYICPGDSGDPDEAVTVSFAEMVERELSEDPEHLEFVAKTLESAALKFREKLRINK